MLLTPVSRDSGPLALVGYDRLWCVTGYDCLRNVIGYDRPWGGSTVR